MMASKVRTKADRLIARVTSSPMTALSSRPWSSIAVPRDGFDLVRPLVQPGSPLQVPRKWRDSFECNRRAAELAPRTRPAGGTWGSPPPRSVNGRRLAAPGRRSGSTSLRRRPHRYGAGTGRDPSQPGRRGGGRLGASHRPGACRPYERPVPRLGPQVRRCHPARRSAERGARRERPEAYVFDALERLIPSSLPTHELGLVVPSEADLHALAEPVFAAGFGIDDWTTVKILCKQCSQGLHEHHDHADEWVTARRIGLAAPRVPCTRSWSAGVPADPAGPSSWRALSDHRGVGREQLQRVLPLRDFVTLSWLQVAPRPAWVPRARWRIAASAGLDIDARLLIWAGRRMATPGLWGREGDCPLQTADRH